MADILLSYEVSINLFINSIIFSLLSVAFFKSIYIVKNWSHSASTSLQYSLEKSSYLVITIIYLALMVKIILLPFFTYTLDSLSTIIPGAMCGAGVISANIYGEPLIILKIFIIIITLLWLTLNSEDLRSKDYRYFRVKMFFFWFIYLLASAEIIIELLYFTRLTTVEPVSCCSVLYKSNSNPLPFNFSIKELIISFYTLYILVVITAYFKRKYFLVGASILFIYISYFSVVYFFSTYVYQLPTHKCPYCLLQPEYYYIGYFIYTSLILATFYTISAIVFKFTQNSFKYSMIFYSLFIFFTSINFFIYLIVNRTFL